MSSVRARTVTNFVSRTDEFHDHAAQATGLRDFGPNDYREPMQLALSDYDAHATLSPIGVQFTEGMLIGLLTSRLLTEQSFKRNPEFGHARVDKPIIIIGAMRSGSTALHRLLASDPELQWLPPWLAAAPMPRPPRKTWETYPAFQRSAREFEQLYQLAPGFEDKHPMAADQPDECRFAIDHSFWSVSLATLLSAPNYAHWVLMGDASYAYRRHRRVLSLIAGADRRRWLLKDPSHLYALDALMKEFPDALIVWTHRDPVPALINATAIIHDIRGVTEGASLDQVARDTLAHWGGALDKAARIRRSAPAERVCDVHSRDLAMDPIGTAEYVYRFFGLPVTDALRSTWQAYVAGEPHAGRTRKTLRPEDLGFTADDADRAIGEYGDYYRELEKQRAS